jgi:hypothetical protein
MSYEGGVCGIWTPGESNRDPMRPRTSGLVRGSPEPPGESSSRVKPILHDRPTRQKHHSHRTRLEAQGPAHVPIP